VVLNSINRARMESGQSRTPPRGWESVVIRLAREHAAELEAKARDLRDLADELDPR